MDKAETNGYLKAVEAQLRAVENALLQLNYTSELTPEAENVFREVRNELANLTQKFTEVRGWNR
jgi:hypothetical protein